MKGEKNASSEPAVKVSFKIERTKRIKKTLELTT